MNLPLPAHTAAARVLSNGNPAGRRRILKAGVALAAGALGVGCGKKESGGPPVNPGAGPVPGAGQGPGTGPEGTHAGAGGQGETGKLWNLSELAPPPDWAKLEAWQETITAEDFRYLLEKVLTDGTSFWSTIEQRTDRALIRMSTALEASPRFELRFATESKPNAAARYWRKMSEMGAPSSLERPLEGVRVALDPGHIGGDWAKMEARWYQMEAANPVMEGELTLETARTLRPLLEAMGAVVTLVRETHDPLTSQQPDKLLAEARESLRVSLGAAAVPTERQVQKEAERLFYRTSEIRTRGHRVNEVLKPDVVVCLHYNAEAWGQDAGKPLFSKANHVHVLAHGCISPAEFQNDDQRWDGLMRLVQRIPDEEVRICDAVARQLADATGLPPFTYLGKNARQVNDNSYLWVRNLLANRVYHCPVVFTEPYVMNNQEVFERIQAGNYEGSREIAGKQRLSIFCEYAQGVADGLADAYKIGRLT